MKLYSSINTYIIIIKQRVITFSEIALSESRVTAASYLVSFFHTNWNLALCFCHCTLYSWQVRDSNLHCRWEANGSVLAHPMNGFSHSSLWKWLCHAVCFLLKTLLRFPHRLNSKSNGPVLFLKTIFRHGNCFVSSSPMKGKDGHGLKLENVQPTFSTFNAMPAKNHQQSIMVGAPWWILRNSRVMSLAHTAVIDHNQQYRREIAPLITVSYTTKEKATKKPLFL